MMEDITSESRFIWKLIWHILITPITFILILFKKRELKDLLNPFYEIAKFAFEPKFTSSIIILNILISIAAFIFLSDAAFSSLMNYPKDILDFSRWYALITSGFIHKNFAHLFGNMLGIFIFGRVVERKLGIFKTAPIYFGALLISSIGESAISLYIFESNIPSLGASGALMGLVGAAMLINPFYFTYILVIPMPVMIAGWLFIWSDVTGLFSPNESGVAYIAHLFGYLSVTITMFLIGVEERSKMKKGLIINIISAIAAFVLFRSFG